MIVAASLVIRNRIQATILKKEKEHESNVRFIKSEYKAMNALMNPHFIFNALNNVQGLVNNNDKRNATEYLGIFADLVRQNMHNISRETISLQKEIELVENYLLLEQLRFEQQLNYAINVSANMDLSDIMVPPLLIQPLVENSIKHGILPLKSRGRRGMIHLNVYEQDDVLHIEVKDNGLGIAYARQKETLHESYGLDNIKNRIQQLSIIQDKEITFNIREDKDVNGRHQWTVVTISLPAAI
jgi:LytS/YehU family sensor histidine kinase